MFKLRLWHLTTCRIRIDRDSANTIVNCFGIEIDSGLRFKFETIHQTHRNLEPQPCTPSFNDRFTFANRVSARHRALPVASNQVKFCFSEGPRPLPSFKFTRATTRRQSTLERTLRIPSTPRNRTEQFRQ